MSVIKNVLSFILSLLVILAVIYFKFLSPWSGEEDYSKTPWEYVFSELTGNWKSSVSTEDQIRIEKEFDSLESALWVMVSWWHIDDVYKELRKGFDIPELRKEISLEEPFQSEFHEIKKSMMFFSLFPSMIRQEMLQRWDSDRVSITEFVLSQEQKKHFPLLRKKVASFWNKLYKWEIEFSVNPSQDNILILEFTNISDQEFRDKIHQIEPILINSRFKKVEITDVANNRTAQVNLSSVRDSEVTEELELGK